MEALNLSNHRGAAVIGKTITLQGATYRVDTLPGAPAGAPYVLLNLRTAIALLRARFMLDEDAPAPPEAGAWVVAVPGGRAVLSLHGGPFEPDAPWSPTFQEAYRVRAEGRLAEAEALIRRVLAQHPTHVLALNHLSGTLLEQNRFSDALPVATSIVQLEPNYPGFANNYIRLVTQFSLAGALSIFQRCHPAFAPNPELDELGATLLLELGEPAQALALLDEALDEPLDSLRAEAVEQCASHARAAPLLEEAQRRLIANRTDGVLDLYERALAAHPRDPYTLANLALARSRAGRHEDAAGMLLLARVRLAEPLNTLCTANAAFALIDAGQMEDAAVIIEGGLAHLLPADEHSEVPFADLPSIGLFVFRPRASAEALPGEALRRLERLADTLAGARSANILRFVALYRRAVQSMSAS